jgi:hypothetical protein
VLIVGRLIVQALNGKFNQVRNNHTVLSCDAFLGKYMIYITATINGITSLIIYLLSTARGFIYYRFVRHASFRLDDTKTRLKPCSFAPLSVEWEGATQSLLKVNLIIELH